MFQPFLELQEQEKNVEAPEKLKQEINGTHQTSQSLFKLTGWIYDLIVYTGWKAFTSLDKKINHQNHPNHEKEKK